MLPTVNQAGGRPAVQEALRRGHRWRASAIRQGMVDDASSAHGARHCAGRGPVAMAPPGAIVVDLARARVHIARVDMIPAGSVVPWAWRATVPLRRRRRVGYGNDVHRWLRGYAASR